MNGALGRGLLRSYGERERERGVIPMRTKERAIGKDHWWCERLSHGGERERVWGGGCLSVRETILKTFYNIFGCKMFYKSYNYAFQST